MSDKKPTPFQHLVAAMSRCAMARGEAQWTNGYRAAASTPEAVHMHKKEMAQWEIVEREEKNFRRLAKRILAEVSK